jgi:hypothetical protein
MTRRQLLSVLVGAPITAQPTAGTTLPNLGYHGHVSDGGFVLTGQFDHAGADNSLAYYSVAQGCSIVLDPKRVPACVAGADALVGHQVRLSLTKVTTPYA